MPAGPGPRESAEVLGGGRGRRAPDPPAGTAGLAPVVLLLAVPFTLAALRQGGCAAGGWTAPEALWRQCSAPLIAAAGSAQAGDPVLRVATSSLLTALAPGSGLEQQRWVLVLWAATAAALSAALLLLVSSTAGHPRARPLALALSPVLGLTVLLTGDLVAVSLATAALWAWSRGRATAAGALGAVALFGGLLPLAVLVAMALTPPPGMGHARRRLVMAAAVTVILVSGPVAALDLALLTEPVRAWWDGAAGPGSPWFTARLAGWPLSGGQVAALSVLGMVLAAALTVAVHARRPRCATADLAVLAVLVVMMSAPALPPSAALWLAPLLALAGIPWREHLLWAGAEAAHALALFGWLLAETDPARALPAGWYAIALALRLVALAGLGWVVWARSRRADGPVTQGPGARADWEQPRGTGTLARLPLAPVHNAPADVGGAAYPPVTERP